MELPEYVDKLHWASIVQKYSPKQVTVDGVECLGKIHKGHEQILFLFTTFFLQLPRSEDHVHCASVFPESTLGLWQQVFSDALDEPVEHDFRQDFACNGEKCYTPAISTDGLVPLVFINSDNICIPPLLRDAFFLPH